MSEPSSKLAVPEKAHAELLRRRTTMIDMAYQAADAAKDERTLHLSNARQQTRGQPLHDDLVVDAVDDEMEWDRISLMEDGPEKKAEHARLKRGISRGERRRKAMTVHLRNMIALGDFASRLLREADMIEPPPLQPEVQIFDSAYPDDPRVRRRKELEAKWRATDRDKARVLDELEEVRDGS